MKSSNPWMAARMVIAAALAANLWYGARRCASEDRTPRDDAYAGMARLTHAMSVIRAQYVDPDHTDYPRLMDGAMRGLLASLDEHCEFLDAQRLKAMQEDTAGEFGGIGVVVGDREGAITIIAPKEDSPGYRAGLLPGDRLLDIGGTSAEGLSLEAAAALMRGEPGTRVKIKFIRSGADAPRTVEIERARIDVPSLKDARMAAEGIGYVRLVQFDDRTASDLDKALSDMDAQGLRGVIVDLRNNPGGVLQSAVDVASRFLPRGARVVYTQGRDERQRQTFEARLSGRPRAYPVIVLVNGGSASAAEIVAGALQDHRRAVLVGERTFGKGSVQSILPMEDGTAIRLTTARYYTPRGRMIHNRGIEPDILSPMSVRQWEGIVRARMEEIGAPRPSREPAAVPEDPQMERAVEIMKGLLAYGETERRA